MLRVANCCHRLLSWDYELQDRDSALRLAQRLPDSGFSDESRVSVVLEFCSPEGHNVVLVPSTGRIQIRIHYLTPLDQRESAALRVEQQLTSALAQN